MKKIIYLIAVTLLLGCSKQNEQIPVGNKLEKLLSLQYVQYFGQDTSYVDEGVDLKGESALVTTNQQCELSSIVALRYAPTDPDKYANGLGFRLILPDADCPSGISKALADELFQAGKTYPIGNNAYQVEISLNRHFFAVYDRNTISGKSVEEDNLYNAFFSIHSTEEYQWEDYGEKFSGKLVTVEFDCKLRRTLGTEFVTPAEIITIQNGKATFYIGYEE